MRLLEPFRVARASRRVILAAGLALVGQACEGPSELIATSDEPFLYLLVAPSPIPRRGPPAIDSAVYALLLTTGSAIRAEPRTAEAFAMTRARDGRPFSWSGTSVPPEDLTAGYRGVGFHQGGNYVLAERSSAAAAGRLELQALDTLLLEITTLGATIRGRTVVPEGPQLTLTNEGGRWLVRWPRAKGSAGYMVAGFSSIVTSDTIVDVTPFPLFEYDTTATLTVAALDSNAYRYVTNAALASAGLDGAFGMFGSVNASIISLAPAAKVRLSSR